MVVVVGVVHHVTVPERIVSEDETSRPQNRKHHLVALAIRPLVTVDERQIERDAQLRSLLQRIADDELDLVCHSRTLNPRTREILHFIVDFERVEPSVLRQSLGHRDSAVAAERPHFEDPFRLDHLHQHLQQPPL